MSLRPYVEFSPFSAPAILYEFIKNFELEKAEAANSRGGGCCSSLRSCERLPKSPGLCG